jgi:Lipoprotein amino terminal region
VTSVRIAPEMPGSGGDLLRAIVALSQRVVAESAGARWTVTEADVTGSYLAAYEQTDATHVHKRKLAYTERRAVGSSTVDAQVISSEATFTLDAAGVTTELRVRDAVRAKSELVPEMTSTSALSLVRRLQVRDMLEVAALRDRAAKLVAYALQDAPTSRDQELAIDRAKVAGRTLPDFLKALQRLPSIDRETKDQRDVRRKLFVEFAALLRLEDAAVDAVLAQIVTRKAHDAALQWDALASAGTPKAQEALRTLIEDPRFEGMFDDAEQGQQARFGMGTVARHLAGNNEQLASDARRVLLARLQSARSSDEISDYLRGLGNAGAAEAEQVILEHLRADRSSVRASAAAALRYIPGPSVDAALVDTFKHDADSTVRVSALAALRERTPTRALLDAVYDAARGDSDETARKQAVATLDHWARQSPEIEAAIAKFDRPQE